MIGTINSTNGQTRTEPPAQAMQESAANRQLPPTAPAGEQAGQVVDGSLGYRLVRLDRVAGPANPGKCRALLTVAGLDRTGLVAAISRLLLELWLNIEGSFGVLLEEGQGLVLLISGAEERMRELEQKVEEMDGKSLRGLRIEQGRRYELQVVTRDEPGIVCRIAEALVNYNVNLTSMMTRNTVAAAEGEGEELEIQAVIVMTIEVPTNCAKTRGQLLDEVRNLFPAPRKVSLDESVDE